MSNGVRATLSNSISGITFLMFLGVASIQDIQAMQPSPSSSSWLLATNKQLWALGKQTTSAHILPSWSGQMWGCVIPGPLPPLPGTRGTPDASGNEGFHFPLVSLWPGLSLKLHYFIIVIRLRPGLHVQWPVVLPGVSSPASPGSRWLDITETVHCDVGTSHMCPF